MLRVSVTMLNSFRLLMTEDWMDAARFDAEVRGERAPTRQMRLGSAIHAILENPTAHAVGDLDAPGEYCATVDGEEFVFPREIIEPCLAVVELGGVAECKAALDYDIDGEQVTVVGKADRLVGNSVIEYKSKWGRFDVKDYAAALQWRYYLRLFRAARVRYHVFVIAEDEGGEDFDAAYALRSIEPFDFFPYPGLAADCERWVRAFTVYAHAHQLEPWLRSSHEAEEVSA